MTVPIPLHGEAIRTAGRCLYGRSWRYAFSVEFGVGGRKLQRMLKDEDFMGAEMSERVRAALRARRDEINAFLARSYTGAMT